MLTLTKMKTLSAVALAVAVLGAPTLAHAGNYSSTAYENCKRSDTESQVLGGVLGAVAGSVFGSQVAGNGARTEGSALGAVLGAVAGSQIANKDCRSNTVYRNEGYRNEGYRNGGYRSTAPIYSSNGYSSNGYSSNGYNTVYSRPRVNTVHYPISQRTYRDSHSNRGHGYDKKRAKRVYKQLAAIDREIDQTRRQIDQLRRQSRYDYGRGHDRRINWLGERLRELKNERKYLSKAVSYR